MSILGITLDYGPFGFMDDYDAGFVCNHSDHNGRYAFNQQPYIGLWNLSCLAQAMLPLAEKDSLKAGLDTYTQTFEREYLRLMRAKLGLQEERAEDDELIRELLGLLQGSHADYTIVFRELGTFSTEERATNEKLREHFMNRDRFEEWTVHYRDRLRNEHSRDDDRLSRMNRVNPKYVLRNYLAQVAIEKAQQKDFVEIDRLLTLLHNPFNDQAGMNGYAAPPPNWGKHLSVSCSS
jgi:serine/tyrosine/threonine adenylyltransferase